MSLQVPDQRSRVAGEVPDHGVDVAALPLGAAAGVQCCVPQPGLDVHRRTELVAEQSHRRVAEGERRIHRHGRRDRRQRSALEPEQMAHAAVVGRDRVSTRGQRESVAVDVKHASRVKK